MSIAKQFEETLHRSGKGLSSQMDRTGLALAVVTNINDDEKLNRVKCQLLDNEKNEETDWCYVMSPMGGKQCGQFFFPRVDDLVVVGFLGGDPHRPIVLGSYWNTDVKPPYQIKDAKVYDYSIKMPTGTELHLYDEPDKQKVTLTLPSGTVLCIDDEKKSVTLADQKKENSLVMDLQKGEVALNAKTKLTLAAGQTTIVLESNGNITEKSSNKIAMSAANIEGKASAKLALEGATAEVKASATMTLQASGPANLKGAIVKIN